MARSRYDRHANSRKKCKHRNSPFKSLQFALSLLLFIASSAFFLRQFITPEAVRRTNSNPRPSTRYHRPQTTFTKPRNWFPTVTYTDPRPISITANLPAILQLSHTEPDPFKPLSLDSIPDGPFPLPPLVDASIAASSYNASAPTETAGSSWTASLAQGIISALPLHWRAEVVHAVPKKDAVGAAPPSDESPNSIFTARRKGAWMGCSRPFHLVCKGVYRAIKITDSIHVLDLACHNNIGWMPHIVQKLRMEFRLVQLTCAVKSDDMIESLRMSYSAVDNIKFVRLDPFTQQFPNGTDMVVAYRFLEHENLIRAMRLFKNIKASRSVNFLTTESFIDEENIPKRIERPGGRAEFVLRLNTGAPPFSFPPPTFEYENDDENPESVPMQISTVKVEEIFAEKLTPSMEDLIDPRKRHVQE